MFDSFKFRLYVVIRRYTSLYVVTYPYDPLSFHVFSHLLVADARETGLDAIHTGGVQVQRFHMVLGKGASVSEWRGSVKDVDLGIVCGWILEHLGTHFIGLKCFETHGGDH
jgi:hypothetical protein